MLLEKEYAHYIESAEYPNSNWTGDEKYVVIDSQSKSAEIVRENFPNIRVITDDEGNVTSVEITEVALTEVIAAKLNEISRSCQEAIYAGIDFNESHYSLTDQDQTNIIVWSSVAEKGKTVPYHADGEHCRPYSPEEFLGLTAAATAHIAHHTTYCNLLMRWVETLTSIDEIKATVYGETQLTGAYLDEYNVNMTLLMENAEEE